MGAYKIPDVKSKHYGKYLDEMPSQDGKTIAITGTTTGLGNITARSILKKGGHVILLNRPSERATAAADTLREECREVPTAKVTEVACDLQSVASVEAAAEQVKKACAAEGLDALVLNAGTLSGVGVMEYSAMPGTRNPVLARLSHNSSSALQESWQCQTPAPRTDFRWRCKQIICPSSCLQAESCLCSRWLLHVLGLPA
jgi:NADPH:quinone reductase-like Zn-dependent oxidoreductase